MKYMNRTIIAIVQRCKRDYKSILLTALLILGANIVYLNYMKNITYRSFEFSVSDILFVSWMPFFKSIYIVPVYLLSMIAGIRYDMRSNRVIRYKSMKNVWLEQVYRNVLVNLVLSAMITGGIVFIGCRMTDILVNFRDKSSLFSLKNNGMTVENTPFLLVVLVFWVGLFLYLELLGGMFLLLRWNFSSTVIVYLIVCIWNLVDLYIFKRAFIFGVGMEYGRWSNGDFRFLSSIIILLLIHVAGVNIAKRKELPNEKK